MSIHERIKPDLRAVPDPSGLWHVQGCTDQGLAWLAIEVLGELQQRVLLFDEDIAELTDEARSAGLVVDQLDRQPLAAA